MSLSRLLPWRRKGESDGRPPKPDPVVKEDEIKFRVQEVTAVFVDGSTETYEVKKIQRRDSGFDLYTGDPVPGLSSPSVRTRGEFIPYETLARPLDIEHVGELVVEYTKTFDHRWKNLRSCWERETYPDVEIVDVTEVWL